MNNSRAQGSAAVVIVIILAGVIIGSLGFVFWQNYTTRSSDSNQMNAVNSTTSDDKKPVQKQNSYSIENVSFILPEQWRVNNDNAPFPFRQSDNFIKAVSILPGEKLRTVYGDGTELFEIYIFVCKNTNSASSKDWFTGDAAGGVGMGIAYGNDMESVSSINGYDTYFRRSINDVYQEVHYVLGSQNTVTYVMARTYQTDSDLPGVGDFRKFEPQIEELVRSVSIK